jgi:hypothetical protein
MQLKLENLAYQQDAIDSVLALFNGQYISSNTPQLFPLLLWMNPSPYTQV